MESLASTALAEYSHNKKALDFSRAYDGAGEEGRTPDLMLGKHRKRGGKG